MSLLSALSGAIPQALAGGTPQRSVGGGWSPTAGGDFSHGAKPDAAYAALPPLFHPAYQEFSDSATPEEAISRWNAANGRQGNSPAPAAVAPPVTGALTNGGVSGVFSNSALNQALSPGGQQ